MEAIIDTVNVQMGPPPIVRHRARPTASPVTVGVLDKFADPYHEGRVSYRLRLVGGEEVIVILPIRADTRETEHIVEELADAVRSELEPRAFAPEFD